jgi:branched-chain amino acid transport system permease protein
MRERRRFVLLWAAVLGASGLAIGGLGRCGVHIMASGLLYASLATSWNWMRATGLFSLGQAAFFGVGAMTQAWFVTSLRLSPWPALGASAVGGVLAALPLIPALRLKPELFGLATLAYAILLKGLAANVSRFGMEGFLLPAVPGFDGAGSSIRAMLFALTLGSSPGYAAFLGRPSGRAATAIRQAPETTLSLGIDPVSERWRLLTVSASTTALAGALYAHLVGSVETTVVFSPTFSVVPLVLGMLGGLSTRWAGSSGRSPSTLSTS